MSSGVDLRISLPADLKAALWTRCRGGGTLTELCASLLHEEHAAGCRRRRSGAVAPVDGSEPLRAADWQLLVVALRVEHQAPVELRVRVPRALKLKLKHAAVTLEVSMSDYCAVLLSRGLDRAGATRSRPRAASVLPV